MRDPNGQDYQFCNRDSTVNQRLLKSPGRSTASRRMTTANQARVKVKEHLRRRFVAFLGRFVSFRWAAAVQMADRKPNESLEQYVFRLASIM
jgi:hypothetical protein